MPIVISLIFYIYCDISSVENCLFKIQRYKYDIYHAVEAMTQARVRV